MVGRVRLGVIGAAGKIGAMRVKSILDEPRAELAAVMDLDVDGATARAQGAPAFSDLDRFLDVSMDAVVISTPAHVREPLCMAAFARGLHVLSEKPLHNTVEGARRIHQAAREKGLQLGGGFNMRYYPAFAFLHDVLRDGTIGEPDHLRVFGGHEGLPKFAHDWEYRADKSGGGALWDVGIHMTDMARHLMGDITEVYGVATNRVWQVEGSEDNAMAILRAPGGLAAIYQATWIEWRGYRSVVEIHGSRGMARAAYAPMETLLLTMDRPGGRPRMRRNRFRGTQIRERIWSWKVTAQDSFARELGEFLDLIDGRREGLRIADGDAALRAVEVAAAIPESHRTGAPVKLPALGGQ
ncbi:putative dehydrogenase [Albidovulum inexpectatum]|uniref:Putative dehydrogenase n=1 Tax=Albidovulum inexpectatum TaxID=196587 RepID=A0A2S5JJE1_9RHOB|nr:Gfo/Idh/MocA family oxidoreductase [Albidovulum inexpectatum]PPB81589.1 putative dehydrogenase [Albidovulum inexpectatum]